jgi:hypothetical protein
MSNGPAALHLNHRNHASRRDEIGAQTEKTMKHKSARILVNHKSLPSAVVAAIAVLLVSAVAQNALASQASAESTVRGIVANANERNDTLTIQLRSDGRTGDFKVQDGLIFNSVQYGDPVEITVETIDGVKTITGLKKE